MGYQKRRFTDEQIEKANSMNLLDYAISKGFGLKKVGKNSYHIKGFGGLYINSLENKWNCFSQNKGGGPIQFVMFIEDKTWVEAVKQLLGMPIDSKTDIYKPISSDYKREENNREFILPEKNNTYKHVFAYLIQTRKIDKDIVNELVKEKKLYEDKNRNCVFVGYDYKGNAKYANKRSTNTNITYKGEVLNSNKAFPFLFGKGDNKVFVFESPIDAMSHATLFKLQGLDWKNQYRLSLGGLSEKGLDRFLNDNKNVTDITLCLDNDEAGRNTTEKFLKKYKEKYSVEVYKTTTKDVNQELKSILHNISHSKSIEDDLEDELEI